MTTLAHEQQALKQLVTLLKQDHGEKLQLTFQIINPQYLREKIHQHLYTALQYLFQTSVDQFLSRQSIIQKLLTYCQTYFKETN